ncbi:hypothetical protein [Natribaculum luteum]|nr:hypothetical protein [Natribaculum luteum]
MGQSTQQYGQGQQMGGQQFGQRMAGRQPTAQFEDHLSNELRIALEDLNHVAHVAEWCARECATAGPQLADCARVCHDVSELAEINERFIARDSPFGPELADLFVRTAIEGLPELEQHEQQHPHITETISAIDRAIDSCETVLQTVGQETQPTGGQRTQGMQSMGGQQMQGSGQQFY